MERFGDAARHFGRASKLQPGNVEALSSQGNALRLSGHATEAVNILETAVRRNPGNRNARLNLGQALNDLGAGLIQSGNTQEATKRFRQALKYTPHHPQALANLGITLEQAGGLEEAARYYQAAIGARPDFADPHFHLAHLRTHRSSPKEIESMRDLYARPGTPQIDRIRLAFGLGFALESAGEYPQAFHFMSEGHRLQGRKSGFSLARESRRLGDIERIYSKDRIASMMDSGLDDDRPVFIVGMPRSGTTLAEQILASHPLVHGAGEKTALARIAKSLAGKPTMPLPLGLEKIKRETLRKAAREYMEGLTRDADGARRITDTTPMNFLMVGLAAMMLPRAKFVICLRDPMDNCLSIYRQYLTGANEYTHDLTDLGGYYLLHRSLVEHWKSALPDRIHKLEYEQLIGHQESEIRRLLEFCGLPFDEHCLEFHESDRIVRSPSAAQVRQPIYGTSVGAWRRYERQLRPLARALGGNS
jgi:tetratricopeptide (TPR) repeat protein